MKCMGDQYVRFWVIMAVTICVLVSRVTAKHSLAVLPKPGTNTIVGLYNRRLQTADITL